MLVGNRDSPFLASAFSHFSALMEWNVDQVSFDHLGQAEMGPGAGSRGAPAQGQLDGVLQCVVESVCICV
jgi:hypothetical protein